MIELHRDPETSCRRLATDDFATGVEGSCHAIGWKGKNDRFASLDGPVGVSANPTDGHIAKFQMDRVMVFTDYAAHGSDRRTTHKEPTIIVRERRR